LRSKVFEFPLTLTLSHRERGLSSFSQRTLMALLLLPLGEGWDEGALPKDINNNN